MPANTDTYSESISRAIRAEMARQGKKMYELLEALGLSRPTVTARLNGRPPFNADELDKVARFLGITAYDLNRSAELASSFQPHSGVSEAAAFPDPPQDSWAQPARSRAKRGAK